MQTSFLPLRQPALLFVRVQANLTRHSFAHNTTSLHSAHRPGEIKYYQLYKQKLLYK